jgi:hypothetical protein
MAGLVGSYTSGRVDYGYLLSGGVFTTIDFPRSTSTAVHGINDSGQVVGNYQSNGAELGFLAIPTPELGTFLSTMSALPFIAAGRKFSKKMSDCRQAADGFCRSRRKAGRVRCFRLLF